MGSERTYWNLRKIVVLADSSPVVRGVNGGDRAVTAYTAWLRKRTEVHTLARYFWRAGIYAVTELSVELKLALL